MQGSFKQRAQLFFADLKANRFPNAVSLAQATSCSRNTAMRCIERLREEYGVPFEYDSTERGYFLTDRNFQLGGLAPGKDEFTALLLLRDLASMVDAPDVQAAIESLWQQCCISNQVLSKELEPLLDVFSSDLTQVGVLADTPVLALVGAAKRGENLEIVYRSPWRHTEPQNYRGRVLKVHFSDGSLYVYFHEEAGRGIVLNGSFIQELRILDNSLKLAPLNGANSLISSQWLDGFGVWAGETLVQVKIEISVPAAEYYHKQRWHDAQEDRFLDDGTLVREFPSMLSPELVRRLLSIGKYVRSVHPPELKQLVLDQVELIGGALR